MTIDIDTVNDYCVTRLDVRDVGVEPSGSFVFAPKPAVVTGNTPMQGLPVVWYDGIPVIQGGTGGDAIIVPDYSP